LWELPTGRQIGQPLRVHSESINSVAFRKDGAMLASAGSDGRVVLWHITSLKQWKAFALRRANRRSLHKEEWQRYLPDDPFPPATTAEPGGTFDLAGRTVDDHRVAAVSPSRPYQKPRIALDPERELILAIRRGDKEAVAQLLAQNVHVNATTDSGNSALIKAASLGNVEIVRMLLDKGTNVYLSGGAGTALSAAAANGHTAVVEMLLRNSTDTLVRGLGGDEALRQAAANGHVATAKALLHHGVSPNKTAETPSDETPLMAAAGRGQAAVVRLLLSEGAAVDTTDTRGETTFMEALRNGHTDVADILLAKGANINHIRSHDHTTAVYWAATTIGSIKTLEYLIRHHADVNIADENGNTPLMEAADSPQKVRLLIKAKADIQARNRYGRGAVAAARTAGRADVVRLLKSLGARE